MEQNELMIEYRLIEQMEEVRRFQEEESKHIDGTNQYQPLSEDELTAILSGHGFIVGAYQDFQLIAITAIYYPGTNEDNLGIDLEWEGEQLLAVAHIEAVVVAQDFRGYGLQKKMMSWAIEQIKDEPIITQLCATAAPDNYGSCKSLMHCGFVVRKLKQKYGGKWRYIFWRPLRQSIQTNEKVLLLPIEDLSLQVDHVNQGWSGIELLLHEEPRQIKCAYLA